MKKYTVNSPYSQSKALLRFIGGLPSSFADGGMLLWNGRNKIKSFVLGQSAGEPETLEVVVKSFRHPSVFRKMVYALRTHKAEKAFLNGIELMRRGVDTPEPVAFVELRHGLWLTAAYYMSRPTSLGNIEGELDRPDWNRQLAADFGRYVAQLHEKGVLHHDLNDTNVLFRRDATGRYSFEVIDINRMAFYPGIDRIPERDLMENLTRFTGNLEIFGFVVRAYAEARGLDDAGAFVRRATVRKLRHDRRWRRRKRFSRLFKHKK